MKKLVVIAFVLFSVLSAAACGNAEQEDIKKYSFYGESEYFTLSDGCIVFDDEREAFYGGVLEAVDPALFSDVKSTSVSFYTFKSNGERDVFSTRKEYSATGEPTRFGGSLGKTASNTPDLLRKIEQGGLWLEVQTVDTADREAVYQLELTVTEARVKKDDADLLDFTGLT